ncbi:MAG: TRAP transporter permease [Bacillota bacterium]
MVQGTADGEARVESLRKLTAAVTAIGGSLFHLYAIGIRPVAPSILHPIHIWMLLVLSALLHKGTSKRSALLGFVDLVAIVLISASTVSILRDNFGWQMRAGLEPTKVDLFFGVVTVLVLLEMTRRVCGVPMAVVGVLFLLLPLLGKLLPGEFKLMPYSPSRVIGQLYSTEGIFGMLAGISATYIFPFSLFAAALDASGTGEFFIDFATALTGKTRGGPAKVAVISSALFGTVSGSAAANVVATGTFTIPLMVRTGYSKLFASAVEAVASTGGQIMPPIMAAAAFLMAQFLGVPYADVIRAALLPALLYYFAVFLAVDAEASRLGLRGLPEKELPRLTQVVKKGFYLLLPVAVVIYAMVVLKYSPMQGGLYGLISTYLVMQVLPKTRLNIKVILDSLRKGAEGFLAVGLSCAVAGIVVGSLTLTGLGIRLSAAMVQLGGGHLVPVLIMTMVATLILSMGLPTSGAYVIAASVCVPALVQLGVNPMAAHLFVFYFATINAITPPVALAAIAASGISGESPFRIGVLACNLGLVAFIVPYMFVYGNELMLVGTPLTIIRCVCTAMAGVYCLVLSTRGYFRGSLGIVPRLFFLVAALGFIDTRLVTDLAAALSALLGAAWEVLSRRAARATARA